MLREKRKEGFTLLEIMLVLAVVAVLLGILLPAMGARNTAKISACAQSINNLQQAANGWLSQGNVNYSTLTSPGITTLKTAGLLPAGFSGTDPWGGTFTVSANATDNNKLDIVASSVPSAAGTALGNLLGSNADSYSYDSDTSTFTVTY